MDSKAYSRVFLQGLLTGVILLVALAPPAEAQGGHGRGRNRQPDQPTKQEKSPKQEVGPGQYSYNGPDVLDAINRGEGPQAMAYFERAAKEDEQQGNLVRAARELHAVTIVANRMGRYQKTIQAASHAIDLFKKASALTPQDQNA